MRRDSTVLIDEELVRHLVIAQFPRWADFPVRPIAASGWDHRTFHLGQQMIARLPSAEAYAAQVEKEQLWLPVLAPSLPLRIPKPLAMGQPGEEYPWKWSIYRWIDGESAATTRVDKPGELARKLAQFLVALRSIDTGGGPAPGAHNFHRGDSLGVYDAEVRKAVETLGGRLDAPRALATWEAALETYWKGPPVWVHGDVSPGNLLLRGGDLHAVIDFGMLCVGDPACDLAIAWTTLEGESREIFRAEMGIDADTWNRGKAWALWKALVVAACLVETNAAESADPWHVINEVLAD